ncbi:tRNA (5-methylaminomethyl-2-thiouridine)(34)-methyltransferase MnmD [Hymenobacter sp. BT770]|uniref:tRNA (5-methylaminomethyl-2-thiouridine)(34)-methyltransferase MnmD n=1 Tax=Hymenobacter sp. BT770 TaxID=2886942 RepID=UPI001D126FEF|nr:tRNA (5-methylaminomethyl-2-thiouridine)(34)-methyltransferase MnmD [Hymenobacter sp. BT770]MCC3151884.1 tRNA (5-methylaminomethyl-2-thiouridine)(34)-methyltransferase MnmD [Hymenobacter sp. BT770]MDO3413494.1 tRNA (5-methylaminomethyl-2-thiouridine)(34)-methyltransferase MnmD [Hymenobacter sp. BT770]
MNNEELFEGPKVEVRLTHDGSATLYVPALDEQYHSRHGARQESEFVYIQAGLAPLLASGAGQPGRPPVRLLEVGLGTGLNALLTLRSAQQAGVVVAYDALETLPLPAAVVAALAPEWEAQPGEAGRWFRALHAAPWGEAHPLAPEFCLTKLHRPLQEAALSTAHYDLIYFDAFAPEKQPELWEEAIFRQLYAAAAPGAVLVSYCAQGQFRRNLRAAGWLTEKLPGPPGKREMTRARKALAA